LRSEKSKNNWCKCKKIPGSCFDSLLRYHKKQAYFSQNLLSGKHFLPRVKKKLMVVFGEIQEESAVYISRKPCCGVLLEKNKELCYDNPNFCTEGEPYGKDHKLYHRPYQTAAGSVRIPEGQSRCGDRYHL
jgi:hypothetical protein